jgi:hypothetical protein
VTEKRAHFVDRLRERLVRADEVDVEERLARAAWAARRARPVVRQHVEDDVDARPVEAADVEGERLEPEVPARVAVDADHHRMPRRPVPPPARDPDLCARRHVGAVARLREDRDEVARIAEGEHLTVAERRTAADVRAERRRLGVEGRRVRNEARIGVERASAGETLAQRRAVTRRGNAVRRR